jgi:hemerythrin
VDAKSGEGRVSVGHADIDAEHQVQLGLMDALEEAVQGGRTGPEVDELLERLLDYSRVHFLSEQLLMRHHAYEGYEDHVQDHDRMVAALEELRAAHDQGRTAYGLEVIRTVRADLMGHIRGRDHELGRFLSGATRADSD